jgi:hypothetical protein
MDHARHYKPHRQNINTVWIYSTVALYSVVWQPICSYFLQNFFYRSVSISRNKK